MRVAARREPDRVLREILDYLTDYTTVNNNDVSHLLTKLFEALIAEYSVANELDSVSQVLTVLEEYMREGRVDPGCKRIGVEPRVAGFYRAYEFMVDALNSVIDTMKRLGLTPGAELVGLAAELERTAQEINRIYETFKTGKCNEEIIRSTIDKISRLDPVIKQQFKRIRRVALDIVQDLIFRELTLTEDLKDRLAEAARRLEESGLACDIDSLEREPKLVELLAGAKAAARALEEGSRKATAHLWFLRNGIEWLYCYKYNLYCGWDEEEDDMYVAEHGEGLAAKILRKLDDMVYVFELFVPVIDELAVYAEAYGRERLVDAMNKILDNYADIARNVARIVCAIASYMDEQKQG